jgi:hypothetical protein
MNADQFVAMLDGVKRKGDSQYMARCPAHDDHDPSLSVTEHNGKVLVKCWAGCTALDVVESLGLSLADLFHDNNESSPPHAFAKKEMAEKRRTQERVSKARTYLQVATAALKRGEKLTDREISHCHQAKRFLQSQGAI